MNDVKQMLNEKKHLIENITKRLDTWDLTVEQALIIVEENNGSFQEMAIIDKNIPEDILKEFNENYREQWSTLLNTHQKMVHSIQKEQRDVQSELKQINNKEKVVSNYMSLQNKSMFIEKDY